MSRKKASVIKTRYLTKKDLMEANEAAIREKRNKFLSKDFVNSLPDDFICVVVWEYFHSRYEMRLGITVDLDGHMALLDVSMARFKSLPISKTYSDGSVKLEMPNETEKRRPYPGGRQWQEIQVKKPIRQQNSFRKKVLEAYKYQCAVCDVKIPALLRAAHIIPAVHGDNDTVQNGICLCANHEIAFDDGLLRIFPDGTAYFFDCVVSRLEPIEIRFPDDINNCPSVSNLAKKLELLGISLSHDT